MTTRFNVYANGTFLDARKAETAEEAMQAVADEKQAGTEGMSATPANIYPIPDVDTRWADTRNTDMAVAAAIHAVATHVIDGNPRSPDDIWEIPTDDEWNQVKMIVAEYVRNGDFYAYDDGRYPWGCENIVIDAR